MIDGYKTAIGLVLGGLLIAGEQIGWLDSALFADLIKWVALWTGIGFTHKTAKAGK